MKFLPQKTELIVHKLDFTKVQNSLWYKFKILLYFSPKKLSAT
jgi:hypothetical protein